MTSSTQYHRKTNNIDTENLLDIEKISEKKCYSGNSIAMHLMFEMQDPVKVNFV